MRQKRAFKRVMAFLMSALMALTVLAGDFSTVKSYAEGNDPVAPGLHFRYVTGNETKNDTKVGFNEVKFTVDLIDGDNKAYGTEIAGVTSFSAESDSITDVRKLFEGISIKNYAFETVYFYWNNNNDYNGERVIVSAFKNFGKRSKYDSYIGYICDRGNSNDYAGGYYSYNPTGTLRVVFKKNAPYNVYFYSMGEKVTQNTTNENYVPSLIDTSNLTRDGYDFAGWSTVADDNGNGEAANKISEKFTETPIDCDTTLYAIWTAKTYKTTYYSNGQPITTIHDENGKHVAYPSERLDVPTGMRFAGWSTEATADGNGNKDNLIPSIFFEAIAESDASLYAIWEEVEVIPTATYVSDGKTVQDAIVATKYTAEDGTVTYYAPAYTGNTPTKSGCVFAGWSTDGTEANIVADPTSLAITENTTFTAVFSEKVMFFVLCNRDKAVERINGELKINVYSSKEYTAALEGAIKVNDYNNNKVDGQNGKGVVKDVESYVTVEPSMDSINAALANKKVAAVSADEYVEWYVIKTESDGIHVDGAILNKTVVTVTATAQDIILGQTATVGYEANNDVITKDKVTLVVTDADGNTVSDLTNLQRGTYTVTPVVEDLGKQYKVNTVPDTFEVKGIKYTANFYVLYPEYVGAVKNEANKTASQNAVGQNANHYTGKKASAEFIYTDEIGNEITEEFGKDIATNYKNNTNLEGTTVDNIIGTMPEVKAFEHTYGGNTYVFSNFEWYVLKNTKTTDTPDWHVDGYAKTITLKAPTDAAVLEKTLRYDGTEKNSVVEDYLKSDEVKALLKDTYPNGTLTFDSVDFSNKTLVDAGQYYSEENGKLTTDVVATYTYKATLGGKEYTAETKITVPVKVEIAAVDAVVEVYGEVKSVSYNGVETFYELGHEIKSDVSGNGFEIRFVSEDKTGLTAKNKGTYPLGLTTEDFEYDSQNYNVKIVIARDASLTINPIEAATDKVVISATKTYGDADPDLNSADNKAAVLKALLLSEEEAAMVNPADITISRVAGENVGTYDIVVKRTVVAEEEIKEEPKQEEQQNPSVPENEPQENPGSENAAKPIRVQDPTPTAAIEEVIYIKQFNVLDNYIFDEAGVKVGTFEITKRTAYVTMHDASKYVGDADPMFVGSVRNLAFNDSISIDPWRITGENAGTYGIYANVGSNANYNIEFTSGTLTIIARQAELPTPPVAPPTGPTYTPVTPTPTPTPVIEEAEVPPTEETVVEIPEEATETPQAAEPEKEAAPEVVIEEEAVPEAAGSCWIHWLTLGLTLIYAIYATARAVQNKRELDDATEAQEN